MIEIIDEVSLETLGVEYDDDEAATACFALHLYADQVRNGNIKFDSIAWTTMEDIVTVFDDVRSDLDSGSRVLAPKASAAIIGIVLPFIHRLYAGRQPGTYEGICTFLEVKPADLCLHALAARNIINKGAAQLSIV